MNREEKIKQMVEEALASVDGMERATPKPYLLTRVQARLGRMRETTWERLYRLVARPVFVVPAILVLLLVNVAAMVIQQRKAFTAEQTIQLPAEDYSYSVATIYDIENSEP